MRHELRSPDETGFGHDIIAVYPIHFPSPTLGIGGELTITFGHRLRIGQMQPLTPLSGPELDLAHAGFAQAFVGQQGGIGHMKVPF